MKMEPMVEYLQISGHAIGQILKDKHEPNRNIGRLGRLT